MCAQFMMRLEARDLMERVSQDLGIVPSPLELRAAPDPNSAVFPHRPAWVLVGGERPRLALMNFSLVPSWSEHRRPKFASHNARVETARSKPTWRESFRRFRCLVPVSSFVEPIHVGQLSGHWVGFEPRDRAVLWAAGLFSSWVDRETGEITESFALLTSTPHPQVAEAGHDRTPLFLRIESAPLWVNGEVPEPAESWLERERADLQLEVVRLRPFKGQKKAKAEQNQKSEIKRKTR